MTSHQVAHQLIVIVYISTRFGIVNDGFMFDDIIVYMIVLYSIGIIFLS